MATATYYIASDYIGNGVSDAYSCLFIDRDGYDVHLTSGTVTNKDWTQDSGFLEFDEDKFTAGYGSGTYGDVKDTIVDGTKYGIVADENNIWVIISGSKVPYEMWGSGTYFGVSGDGTANKIVKWIGTSEIEDSSISDDGSTVTFSIQTSGIDHGDLDGLADDDHPQYGALAQNETVAGNWIFGGTTSGIDHTELDNKGTNTHADIDTHIGDGNKHFLEGSIDHGSIAGLGDNDHSQYSLTSHHHDAAYSAIGHDHDADYSAIGHTHALNDLSDVNAGAPTDDYVLTWDDGTSRWIAASGAGGGNGGVTDHGALTGLGDDDHTHYAALAQNETVTGAWSVNNNFELSRVGAAGNVTLIIEADSNNAVESANPSLLLKQDGGAITFTIGIQESGNLPYLDWGSGDLQIKGSVDVIGKFNANAALRVGGTSTDPASDSYVNLGVGSAQLKVYTNYGYVEIGPRNTSWCHFNTDRGNFYFYKGMSVLGHILPATDSVYNLGSSTKRFNNVYFDGDLSNNVAADALTLAEIADLLMWGSANAAWIPLSYDHRNQVVHSVGLYIVNATGTRYSVWLCPLPTNKGSQKLRVGDVKLNVADADVNNYLNAAYIMGVTGAGVGTELERDSGNITTTGEKTITFSYHNVSAYDYVFLVFQYQMATANAFDHGNPMLKCYYAP